MLQHKDMLSNKKMTSHKQRRAVMSPIPFLK